MCSDCRLAFVAQGGEIGRVLRLSATLDLQLTMPPRFTQRVAG